MNMRRSTNDGKREREAGKRHRRVVMHTWKTNVHGETVAVTLKLGRKHSRRVESRIAKAVAESEKRITGTPENC